MMIMENIWRKTIWYDKNGMIMDSMGKRKSPMSGKNNLVFGEDRLEFGMHKGCLNGFNGVEFGNNVGMTFFEVIFHSMGTNDLKGSCCDVLELTFLSFLWELHG
jgi:predicted membrane GTPase involved in stress response